MIAFNNQLCAIAAVLGIAVLAFEKGAIADDQPSAAQPATAAAPAAEAPALRHARHDARRWAERAKPLTDAAAQAAAALDAANKAVADAKAEQAAATKAMADTAAAGPVP